MGKAFCKSMQLTKLLCLSCTMNVRHCSFLKQQKMAIFLNGLHLWAPIYQSIYDFGLSKTHIFPPRWRREQEETFALPVTLSADTSHQSGRLAPQDDEHECRAYLSRLGVNKVLAPPSVIGSYELRFWQMSKSHSPWTNAEGDLVRMICVN